MLGRSKKYSEAEIAERMEGKNLYVIDFEGGLVRRLRYVWEGMKLLPDKRSRLKDGYKLVKSRKNVSEERNRANEILKLAARLPHEISRSFGIKLAGHKRMSLLEHLFVYEEFERAILTRDEVDTMLPTMEDMAAMGLKIGKYIASKAEVSEGMITGGLAGTASRGVDGWDDRWYMLTPEDKKRGIEYIARSYALEQGLEFKDALKKIVYVTDVDDPGEELAIELVTNAGGTVLDAKRLPRLKRRPHE